MSAANGLSAPTPSISTAEELNRLKESRPTPVTQPQLTPNSYEAAQVQRDTTVANEQRIKLLENRLDRAKSSLINEHGISNVRGQAKADFGRE